MNIVNPIVEEYTLRYYKPLNDALGELRKSAEEQRVPIILKGTEAALLPILKIKKPAKILEIGTAIGYSALFFAYACPESEITTIERDKAAYDTAVANIEIFGMSSRIACLCGEANAVLEELENEGRAGFDLIFIDAGKSHYMEFWERAMRLAAAEAVIICDNVLLKGAAASDEYDPGRRHRTNIRRMRAFTEYLMSLETADTSIIPAGDGLTISIIKGKK